MSELQLGQKTNSLKLQSGHVVGCGGPGMQQARSNHAYVCRQDALVQECSVKLPTMALLP